MTRKKYDKNVYKNFYDPTKDFENEPREFCYGLSQRLICEAINEKGRKNWYASDKTVQAILLLIYCWNFAARKTKQLKKDRVGKLLVDTKNDLESLKNYSILNFDTNKEIEKKIKRIFRKFKRVFGQTGASKALSVLNTKLFVMWDTNIRKELRSGGYIKGISNGEKPEQYHKFLKGIKEIIEKYNLIQKIKCNEDEIAKKIDEFHFVKWVMKKKNKNK